MTDILDETKRFVVTSEAEMELKILEQGREGRQLAVASNTGLPKGSVRLTFLPASAFKKKKQKGS